MSEPTAKIALIKFLSSFSELNAEQVNTLAAMIPIIAPSKGDVLIESGEVPAECYFVLKGLVREYMFIDGTERTIAFYTESNGTITSSAYTNQTPSSSFVECSEDSLIIAGNIELEESHFEQFPELIEITRKMMETDLNKSKSDYTNFILSSPKERYEQFLECRPDLANRVPLNQIASYLGMTPESLSRIRKRLVSPED